MTSSTQQRAQRIVLGSYPQGHVRPDDFSVEAQDIPAINDGEFLVRAVFISVDPMLRLFIDAKPLIQSMSAMPLGTTIPGPAVGEIIDSKHADYAVGDLVEGRFGWQHYAVSEGVGVKRVNPHLGPIEHALGIAGLPGFTAYCGLHTAGGVKAGQTFLVSGAAGAVGSAAGALIHARGGRAVGIAGGTDKCRYLTEQVGYAAAVDRYAADFHDQLASALPTGADVYFDNVGGPMLSSVMPFMARGALVLICGLMAQYQGEAPVAQDNLPAVLRAVMFKGLRIQAFNQVGQEALRPAFEAELSELIASGRMNVDIHIEEGIERLPFAMAALFDKSVTGKVVVRVGKRVT
jgi:NADPH-dependent curcumin reductase CurA